jgi:hypothetical protein
MTTVRNLFLALGCAILLAAAMKPAAAATITYEVTFSADQFVDYVHGTTPPFSLLMGELHVDITPGVSSFGPATWDFFLPPGAYVPTNYTYTAADDSFEVWGSLASLYIKNFTTSPSYFTYLYLAGGEAYHSFNGLVQVSSTAVTPIPAALPLFAAALSGLGLAAWRRRKSGASIAA